MSKSRGNTVDPLDWIDRFGADATRFTLARGASPGGDVAVSEEWVTGARNFCNKLWNATRFALLNGARVPSVLPDAARLTVADRWILSRLGTVTAEVDACSRTTSSASSARRCTTSPGTRCATGTWNWPRRPCRPSRADHP
jgi:valyl-tRNA synthetase